MSGCEQITLNVARTAMPSSGGGRRYTMSKHRPSLFGVLRLVLRNKIRGSVRMAVLVRAAVNGDGRFKIAVGGRRGSLPFQSGGLPGIIIGHGFAAAQAMDQIDDEGQ